MKIKYYLWGKKYLIFFYLILMSFVSAIVFLDSKMQIHFSNIVYLNTIGLFLFCCFLLFDYSRKKTNYTEFKNAVEVENIPMPKSPEQRLYFELVEEIIKDKQKLYIDFNTQKKEHMNFIQSWVHEIKTPISTMRLILEVYSIDKDTSHSLIEEIDKIENYVDQALYFARVDDFAKDYLIKDCSLEKIINEIIKKNKQVFIGKHIKPILHDYNYTIKTDSKWLDFILNQIIINALKYTPDNGNIEIYCLSNEKGLELHIKDSGIGIISEDLPRVFDKGFTGETGRKFSKSTGIGLYLCKELCIKLGHDIKIDSEPNKYTDVIIHFPKLYDYLNKKI